MDTKTPLQKVLYYTCRKAWQKRNSAAHRVDELLHALSEARRERDEAQGWFEMVAAELKASGYEKADDYLTRIWMLAKPAESPFDAEHTAILEAEV